MGRIKSTLIKKTAIEFLKDEENNFTADFDKNKRLLGKNMPSKKVRNKIAGYLARLVRAKEQEKL